MKTSRKNPFSLALHWLIAKLTENPQYADIYYPKNRMKHKGEESLLV